MGETGLAVFPVVAFMGRAVAAAGAVVFAVWPVGLLAVLPGAAVPFMASLAGAALGLVAACPRLALCGDALVAFTVAAGCCFGVAGCWAWACAAVAVSRPAPSTVAIRKVFIVRLVFVARHGPQLLVAQIFGGPGTERIGTPFF